jgi:hypothetical protein
MIPWFLLLTSVLALFELDAILLQFETQAGLPSIITFKTNAAKYKITTYDGSRSMHT